MKSTRMLFSSGELTMEYLHEPGADMPTGVYITVKRDTGTEQIRLDWSQAEAVRKWLKYSRKMMPFTDY
jgi:hypothetical protein